MAIHLANVSFNAPQLAAFVGAPHNESVSLTSAFDIRKELEQSWFKDFALIQLRFQTRVQDPKHPLQRGPIHLFCSFGRYVKSRSPETKTPITPFKTIYNNLILSSRSVESISVGVEKPLRGLSYDDVEDESDDQ
ncbi:hypothetical protein L1049_017731 [Liquidambar formosana]|uniref:Uncharacterized protein n=1 Tax=Liquidambar formosana TaxID=63359 RepID=A0AAP0X8E4_LIQFO